MRHSPLAELGSPRHPHPHVRMCGFKVSRWAYALHRVQRPTCRTPSICLCRSGCSRSVLLFPCSTVSGGVAWTSFEIEVLAVGTAHPLRFRVDGAVPRCIHAVAVSLVERCVVKAFGLVPCSLVSPASLCTGGHRRERIAVYCSMCCGVPWPERAHPATIDVRFEHSPQKLPCIIVLLRVARLLLCCGLAHACGCAAGCRPCGQHRGLENAPAPIPERLLPGALSASELRLAWSMLGMRPPARGPPRMVCGWVSRRPWQAVDASDARRQRLARARFPLPAACRGLEDDFSAPLRFLHLFPGVTRNMVQREHMTPLTPQPVLGHG